MKTGVKIIWSIVVFVIGFILAILCQAGISQSGKVSMIPGLILLVAIVGIIAIWRKRGNSNNKELHVDQNLRKD